MEAIGELAGGVAHDFNNQLTVIKGYANILLDNFSPNDPLREDVKEILLAGKQAATLTSQLLAFSRKQLIQQTILDLNKIVREVGKMLDRLLGETIQLKFKLQSNPGLILADPGQMHQILMNLAVNARDAMPAGGKLEIKTADVILDETYVRKFPFVKSGLYVLLAMNDTGIGMDASTQERIFEPFFTTKKPGSGTGLGLSTVYGIVKQNNGFILVESELGKGTNFKIYLPCAEGAAAPLNVEEQSATVVCDGGTVLLAEDESSVRTLISRILRKCGYQVLEASNGKEALEIAGNHNGTIDLVLTDSVMPGLSGKEMVSQLENQRPGTKVLYISGYTNTGIVHEDVLEPGIAFLPKPFTAEQLLQKIQSVLRS
jgi:two-component system, cell cycle sensor histidine kinase and response regulator CckA